MLSNPAGSKPLCGVWPASFIPPVCQMSPVWPSSPHCKPVGRGSRGVSRCSGSVCWPSVSAVLGGVTATLQLWRPKTPIWTWRKAKATERPQTGPQLCFPSTFPMHPSRAAANSLFWRAVVRCGIFRSILGPKPSLPLGAMSLRDCKCMCVGGWAVALMAKCSPIPLNADYSGVGM